MIIKRTILSSLENHLSKKEVTLLAGPRQAGKTFLMHLLEDKLNKRGEKTLFLSLDFDENKKFFVTQETLLAKIRLEVGEAKAFIFIDEVQRKDDAGLFLKGLYDRNLPYKFIVAGSGSLELKEKIHESLAGRKRLFSITPLTFNEFINFSTDYRYEHKLAEFFSVEKEKIQAFLRDYLTFGGYPQIVLNETINEKQNLIADIYQSYLEKDLVNLLHLKKSEIFTNLVKILASQIGGLVNVSELASTLGIADKTIRKYLWYLEKTFIINKVTPYFRNVRKEITKAPLYYFYDLGLRNYSLGLFGILSPQLLSGHLFENFIFNLLKEKLISTSARIHFWRTRDNAEVDFVIDTGAKLIPIEVKYRQIEKPAIPRSLRSFLAKYQPKEAFIVHLGEKQETTLNQTKVFFLPFYLFDQIDAH